jgi:hypothetical protein
MIRLKVPLGFAAFGAAVSLLAGIIGGNPFGVILLRVILSAGVCGVLGLGFISIVNKFLPELAANPTVRKVESGEEVDIVIDEDIPIVEEEEAEADMEPAFSGEPEVGGDLPESLVQDDERLEVDEFDEEPEEDVLNLEDAESEERPAAEELTPGPASPEVTNFEDLDALPDIDQFSPTMEEGTPAPKKSRTNSQVEEVIRDQNPENLARAVRTFIKKDQ